MSTEPKGINKLWPAKKLARRKGEPSKRGGARIGSGRPRKVNPEDFVQITCVLRKDTVERLREGAGGKQKFFGHFLQFHLDRFPIPTHEEYLAMREGKQLMKLIKRRHVPVVFGGNVEKARRAARASGKQSFRQKDPAIRKFLREFQAV